MLRYTWALKAELGDYSLAALNPNLIAEYRDQRLATGKSANTVRLELPLLSHLFTIAIKEWRLGLVYNPVMNIRKPPPGPALRDQQSFDYEIYGTRMVCNPRGYAPKALNEDFDQIYTIEIS